MSFAPWITAVIGLLIGWAVRREISMRERRETQAMWEEQVRRAESQRDQRKSSLEAKERRIAKLESQIQRHGSDLDQLRRKIAERELELRDLGEASRNHEEAHRQTSRRVLELADKKEMVEQESKRYKQRIQEIEAENQLFREMMSTAEIALLERERTIEQLESRPNASPLPDSIDTSKSREARPLRQDAVSDILDLEKEFTPQGIPIPRLEDLVETPASDGASAPRDDTEKDSESTPLPDETSPVAIVTVPHDDLTRIKGIGPAFARRLEAIGVTRFAQLANWSSDDLEAAAGAMEIPARRIRQQGWVESARALV